MRHRHPLQRQQLPLLLLWVLLPVMLAASPTRGWCLCGWRR
jgi:hypothetical protein